MKKSLTVVALLAGAVSVYSQGTFTLNDYAAPAFQIGIFNTQTTASTPVTYNGVTVMEIRGNPSGTHFGQEANGGTTVYSSYAGLSGTGWDAEVLVGAGNNDSVSSLTETGVIENFYTGGLAGLFMGNQVVAASGVAGAATVAVAAWANTGTAGAANSLAQAITDGYAWGISAPGNLTLATGAASPPLLPSTVTSFSLGTVPEPSTIALGVIGASAFLMRLRRKH
jgi:hypothetical protein